MTVLIPRFLPRPVRLALARFNAGEAGAVPRFLPRNVRTFLAAIHDRLADPGPGDLPVVRGLPRAVRVAGVAADLELDAPTGLEWLPEGAIAYADFVGQHYYADGGEVAVTDLFGTDPAGTFNWGENDLLLSQLKPEGWDTDPDEPGSYTIPAIKPGGMKDALVSDSFTLVMDFVVGSAGATLLEWWTEPDETYSMSVFVFADNTGIRFSSASAIQLNQGTGIGPDDRARVALTISPTEFAMSVNGAAAVTDTPGAEEFQDWNYVTTRGGVGAWKSVTVYEAVAASGLPALSAL